MLRKWIFLILLFFNITTYAQLKNIAYQIYLYDTFYSTQDSLRTISDFMSIAENNDLRDKYIISLKNQLLSVNNEIKQLDISIKQLSNDLKIAKANFGKVLLFLYLSKKFIGNRLLFVFSASSFNRAFLRYNFLKLISFYLDKLAYTIEKLKNDLKQKRFLLKKEYRLKKDLLQKLTQQKHLQQLYLKKQYALLKSLEQKQQSLRLKLNKISRSFEIIASYIEHFKNLKTDDTSLTLSFFKEKGKLPLPLSNAVIISSFGIHKHRSLKNITVRNDGIDLASNTDTLVKNIFDGRVVAIITLPTKAKAIIIKHGEFFTVYNNLNQVYVVDNQFVFKKQIIASISPKTSPYSFSALNFQIWKNTKKLNPAKWLKFN